MTVNIIRKSPISGVTHSMEIECTEDQILRYHKGEEYIQDIFPNLSPAEREFILTGITSEEWDEVFGEEE